MSEFVAGVMFGLVPGIFIGAGLVVRSSTNRKEPKTEDEFMTDVFGNRMLVVSKGEYGVSYASPEAAKFDADTRQRCARMMEWEKVEKLYPSHREEARVMIELRSQPSPDKAGGSASPSVTDATEEGSDA